MSPFTPNYPISKSKKSRPSFLPAQESLSGTPAPAVANDQERIQQLTASVTQQEQQVAGLLNIAASLRESRDPTEAMGSIVVQISDLLDADRTTIYQLDEETDMLIGLAVQGESKESSISVGIPNGRGLAGLVASKKLVINLADAYSHDDFDVRFDKLTGYRTRSVLCVPMLNASGVVIGVVQVLNKNIGIFSLEDQQLLCALAAQAAITLEALTLECELKTSYDRLQKVSAQVRQQLEEQALLFELETVISSSDEIIDLADAVLSKVASVVGCELVVLFAPGESGVGPAYLQEVEDSLREIPGTYRASDQGLLMIPKVELGEGIIGKSASRGEEIILVGDQFELEAIPKKLSSKCDYPVRNALATPLIDGRDSIGSICFINCEAFDLEACLTPLPSQSSVDLDEYNEEDREPVDQMIEYPNECKRALGFASLIARQLGRGMNQILKRQNALQEDRMMMIGQMLSGVLHDMRGPLTSISGYAQVMARSDDHETRSSMSKTVKRKINELNEMTREVMAFARGERTVLNRKVYLRQFVDNITESMKLEFDEHGIGFSVELSTRGVAYFDEGKIMRVITNIARNARQAMGDQGRLIWKIYREGDVDPALQETTPEVVALSPAEASPEGYPDIHKTSSLVFYLEDNGPGIPESIRERVFDAFMTSGKKEGTGLGLAIVKRIVDDHKGSIRLSTSTGVGTTFTIRIPQP